MERLREVGKNFDDKERMLVRAEKSENNWRKAAGEPLEENSLRDLG